MRASTFVCICIAIGATVSPGPARTAKPDALWAQCKGQPGLSDEAQRTACNALVARRFDRRRASEALALRCSFALDHSDRDGAVRDCSKAIKLDPRNLDAYHTRAVAYLSQHQNDLAIADANALLRLYPAERRPGTLYLRGRAYSQKGDYARAIIDFTVSLFLRPGYAMVESGLRDARSAQARVAAGQKPGDARAWCDGNALPGEGYPDDLVIQGCTKLIESGKEADCDMVTDYYQRGRAHDFERHYDEAVADFSEAIRRQPDHADAYRSRGSIYWVKQNYEAAVSDMSSAIRYRPADRLAFWYRGQSQASLGRFDLAIADFEQVTKLAPDNAEAYVGLCRARIGKGEFDRAIADCDSAIKLSQTSEATEGWNGRGDAHFLKGDFAAAIADYEKSLGLWPEYPEALYGRGAAKARSGDASGAADMAAARKLKPEVEADERKLGIAAP